MRLLSRERREFYLDTPGRSRATRQGVQQPHQSVPTFAAVERKPNWRSAAAGAAFQVLIIAVVLVLIPLLVTEQIALKTPRSGILLTLDKPVEPYKPKVQVPRLLPPPVERIKAPPPAEPLTPPRIEPARIQPPQIEVRKPQIQPPVVARKPVTGVFDNKPPEAGPKHETPAVRTDLFAGSSAKPTLTVPAQKVQTGGFGDPNGVKPGPSYSNKGLQVATVGSFDLPGGPGHGNGSGGAHGVPGTVRSAGFGNSIASAGGGGGNGGHGLGGVRSGGFGDSTPPVVPERRARVAAAAGDTPVEILSKPRPAYTAEARQLKVQGEVLVSVVFGADGRVRVQRVTRGLGHGLDENAISAAGQIRFKPARHGGQPVDSTAVVHIVFQMAY